MDSNYECARAVVKRAETNGLFVLGDTHGNCLAINSRPCYSLKHKHMLSMPADHG